VLVRKHSGQRVGWPSGLLAPAASVGVWAGRSLRGWLRRSRHGPGCALLRERARAGFDAALRRCRVLGSALGIAGLAAALGAYAAHAAHAAPATQAVHDGPPQFQPVGQQSIPRGVVASLAQDQAGFLWVATGDGLVRYDGYRFQPRGRDGVEPVRANLGWVRALLAAPDGKVWIGTEAQGLAVYDPRTDRLQDWPAPGQGPAGRAAAAASNAQVRALAAAPDGSVWVGTLGGGLMRVPADGSAPRIYRQAAALAGNGQGAGLPDDRVLSLLVDTAGTLWVGTWRALVRLPAGGSHFEPVLADSRVQALFQTADGHLWAGGHDGRLWRMRPGAPVAEVVASPAGAGAVTSLTEAPRGRLWVGRTLGVDLHDVASGRPLQALRADLHGPGALLGRETTALLRDQAGSVWVGSLGGGLMRHDEPRPGLATVSLPDPLRASARSLLARRDGSLWAADESGNVWRFNAALRQAERWQPLPAAPGTGPAIAAGQAGARIEAMVEADDGGTWLATADRLYQLDARGRLLRTVPHAAGNVQALLLAEQQLWISGEGGLYWLAAAWPAHAAAAVPRAVAGFSGSALTQARAPDGAVWVGGSAGLFRAVPDPDGPAVQAVPVDPAAGLGNPVVIGLLFGRDGTLWLDTAVSGLHRSRGPVAATPASSRDVPPLAFDRVSERLGTAGRPFGANLLQDARGRIWSQLHVYDPATDRLHALADAEGRHNGTGWFQAYARLPDGRMVFGGSRGLFVVDGSRYEPGGQGPPLVLAGLLLNGVRQSAPLSQRALALGPDQRSFAVEFAALAYQQPQAVRYPGGWRASTPNGSTAMPACAWPATATWTPGTTRCGWRQSARMACPARRS
jgi:ligand-binding sensor domain-containing protein